MSKKKSSFVDSDESNISFLAEITIKSLHDIVSRYGDAGFWSSLAGAGIKFRYGAHASAATNPYSDGINKAIFGLRAAGGILSVIEVISDLWQRQKNERDRRKKIAELKELKIELIEVVFALVDMQDDFKQCLLIGDPKSWSLINIRLLAILKRYRKQFRNIYNKQLWYELERDIYDGDIELSQKQSLGKSQKNQPLKRKTIAQRGIHSIGDALLGLIWGAGFVTGIAGIFSVNIATLPILISAMIVGVLYAILKVSGHFYLDHKHDRIAHDLDLEVGHICTTIKILRVISQLKQVDFGKGEQDSAMIELYTLVPSPRKDWCIRIATRTVYFTAVTIVIGAGLAYSFKSLFLSFAKVLNTAVQISTNVFNFMLVVGVVFSMLQIGFKIALAVKMAIDREREKISQINRHQLFQERRAMKDQDLAMMMTKSSPTLLVITLQRFFTLSPSVQQKNHTMLFKKIEAVIGHGKDTANDSLSYYRFLTAALSQATTKKHAIKLVRQLKIVRGEQMCLIDDSGINSKRLNKSSIIHRDDSGKFDHQGNLHRFIDHFKKSYNFVYDSMFPVMIGLAIGSIFFTGPAYFIVIGTVVPLLVALFLTNKVLEHRSSQRMEEYSRKLAQMDLRDQAVSFQKLLDLERCSDVRKSHIF